MKDLTITLIQTDLIWEEPEANRNRLTKLLRTSEKPADLIILPEMFTTGFTMNVKKLGEPMTGSTLEWLKEFSASVKQSILGSLIIVENGRYYNRVVMVCPDGRIQHSDKRHLFRMAGENEVYTAGQNRVFFELNGWKVLPLVCYDLRFPVWSRSLPQQADLIVYMANWPSRRAEHWQTLLKARAIENQVYVAGVNRLGQDGRGVDYQGDSLVVDALGNEIGALRGRKGSLTCRLSFSALKAYREKFPVWKDADSFHLDH